MRLHQLISSVQFCKESMHTRYRKPGNAVKANGIYVTGALGQDAKVACSLYYSHRNPENIHDYYTSYMDITFMTVILLESTYTRLYALYLYLLTLLKLGPVCALNPFHLVSNLTLSVTRSKLSAFPYLLIQAV